MRSSGSPSRENLADGDALPEASAGWPTVCANLKSLLETGHVLPRAPWEMHADLRATQMARHDIALQLPLKVIAGPLRHCQGKKESPPWVPQLTNAPSVDVGMLIRRRAVCRLVVPRRRWYVSD